MTSPIRERVSFPSQNKHGELDGSFSDGDPSASGSKKGLILIHEWWGLNEQIQKEGEMVAKDGKLCVIVPDFYRGTVTDDYKEAGHLMAGLDWPGALQDIAAATRLLKSKGCAKVGISGFCMGGALSFAAAAVQGDEISAAAPFYGIPDQSKFKLEEIRIPVQGHFGKLDSVKGFSSKEDYLPLNEKLLKAGVPFELFEYDAAHAFVAPLSPNYDAAACKLALERMYKFMQKHLSD